MVAQLKLELQDVKLDHKETIENVIVYLAFNGESYLFVHIFSNSICLFLFFFISDEKRTFVLIKQER